MLANNALISTSCMRSGFLGRPKSAREIKTTATSPRTNPIAGMMIAPATAPIPNSEPIQYICAEVAAAPESAPIAAPVDAVPTAEMNISIPPMDATPTIFPAAICATRLARRARRPDTWVIAAMMPFRSRSMHLSFFLVVNASIGLWLLQAYAQPLIFLSAFAASLKERIPRMPTIGCGAANVVEGLFTVDRQFGRSDRMGQTRRSQFKIE